MASSSHGTINAAHTVSGHSFPEQSTYAYTPPAKAAVAE